MRYTNLAFIYDDLMADIDYPAWASYLEQLIDKFGAPGKKLMDLGCGTGSISLELAHKGFEIVGIDYSEEMLSQADYKFRAQGYVGQFYNLDIRQLTLNTEVDIVIATFDTLNYLLENKDIQNVCDRVYQNLRAKGLFVFDLNTAYKLKQVLGDQVFTYNTSEICYIWENEFDFEHDLSHMYLTFFVLDQQSKLYQRFEEYHQQKAYEIQEIIQCLESAGLQVQAVFDELSFRKPQKNSERIFFVAQKI